MKESYDWRFDLRFVGQKEFVDVGHGENILNALEPLLFLVVSSSVHGTADARLQKK